MQTHYFSRDLPQRGRGTRAYWAIHPARKAIVFVHGFRGSAVGTWTQFPDLLPGQTACSGCDLVFYGYDSLYRRAYVNAAMLLAFLNDLMSHPAELINATLPAEDARPSTFSIDKLVLVAHSLGAVVARQALLDAERAGHAWRDRTHLVLFAPAHMGASVLPLIFSALGAFKLPIVPEALQFGFPSLQDLAADSQTITDLRTETRRLLDKGAGKHLVARSVFLAEDDRVVNPNRFCDDPPPSVIRGRGHINICKPDAQYQAPLKEVLRIL